MGAGRGEKQTSCTVPKTASVKYSVLVQKLDMQDRFQWLVVVLWLKRLCFLGAFKKMWKATLSFVTSVCLSAWNKIAVCWTNFHESWVLSENLQREIQVRIKSDTSNRILYTKTEMCDRTLLYSCYREKWFRQKSQRNSKGILYSVTFFSSNILSFLRQHGKIW